MVLPRARWEFEVSQTAHADFTAYPRRREACDWREATAHIQFRITRFSKARFSKASIFQVTGEPTAIAEVSPGEFLGVFEAAPAGISSISSTGNHKTL